jgi:hypothetical protein
MSSETENRAELPPEPGFAPKDLTDGRVPGDWKSRYDAAAWRYIWREVSYLSALLLIVCFLMLLVWLRYLQWRLHLSPPAGDSFSRYTFAWLSGMLGGILFAMKWLYHSVAKQRWHVDRQLWRYLTPHISGGLSFATVAIVRSLDVFDPKLASTSARITALGFLVGFFSDNALAKLSEIAETIFGPTRRFSETEPRKTRQAAQPQDHEHDGPV